MAVPALVIAAGWIPFVVVLVLTFIFSSIYIQYYQSRYDSEISSTVTAIVGLTVTILTSLLLPVDIFLVSFMKDSNGTFKNWAEDNSSRNDIETAVLYSYYGLYAIVSIFIFMIIPFVYFFYEEKDEESSFREQLCTSIKYTVGFIFIAGTLLLVGAFIPLSAPPNQNATEWQQLGYLFHQIGSRPEDSFSFLLNILILIGTLTTIRYTAYGLGVFPIGLIKGSKSRETQHGELVDQKLAIQNKIHGLKLKYRAGQRMVSRDRDLLQDLEEKERILEQRESEFQGSSSHWEKCSKILRPFEICIGIFFLLVTLTIIISLLLTNIDRAIYSLGYDTGYAITQATLPNPLGYILNFSQKVFPLDYIIIIGIVLYFILSSMSAIKILGIQFLCIRLYKIRSHRTRPQALLLMCMSLMFIILALNKLMYSIVPQYMLYGSQHYWKHGNLTHGELNNETSLEPCNILASPDDCVMTRIGMLIINYFFKATFFGAANYWMSWVFLIAFVIGAFVAVIQKHRSIFYDAVNDSDSEDENMIDA